MKKTLIVGLGILGVLLVSDSLVFPQEGILKGPTPPLRVQPDHPQSQSPSLPASPPPPALKPPAGGTPEKGVVNPRTGEFYQGTIGGIINPKTGEVLPKVEGGYVNPKTGEFLPAQK
jgi:hypothetical protein